MQNTYFSSVPKESGGSVWEMECYVTQLRWCLSVKPEEVSAIRNEMKKCPVRVPVDSVSNHLQHV